MKKHKLLKTLQIKYIYLFISICIMISIFCFSNEPANVSSNTSNSVGKVLSNIIIFRFIFSIFPLRKCAHFFIYFLLGASFCLTIYEWIKKIYYIWYSVLFSFIYACLDEFHQYFVIGRSASMKDVFIDTSGSLLSTIIIFLFMFIFIKIKNKTI